MSAFAGLHYFAARNSAETVLTWPEGLAHLSENLRRHAGLQEGWQWPSENRIRLEKPASVNASAVKIKPLSDGRIEVWLRDNAKGGNRCRHRATRYLRHAADGWRPHY